ncbi:ATP-binding cassette domain-containing protein [Jinshanibacter sp. LJY008]|uniref:ATP-binding cassette domain-containing protein n=1 Tax=Limnobaculum eriocheiris TaxID=2897391 RepID=A0A9X1SLK6_9GAMM|nr:ATP-binding cassette domain-containing protein [Limnobaculum eriocheiris]MCD1127191.1 ATP-binding cassette domain-containing protein [Limnobaculum eriocheiris]
MLQTHNLSITQGETTLWSDLNLSVSPTERLGIFAPSGYGKTTLGRVLAGWQQPTKGHITLDNLPLPLKGYCPVQLVPQHPERTFNPARTTGAALHDVWQPENEWLEALAIDPELLKRYPSEVSGGELARIALLRALAPKTRFLIADEITAQLDPLIQAQTWRFILQQSQQRKLGMVIISHSKALLDQVCTQVWQSEA